MALEDDIGEIRDELRKPPLTLRWTWDDPYAARKEASSLEGSHIGATLTGLPEDYLSHVELERPNNSWLYVSYRLVDYPGKLNSNPIVRCLTPEGEWMKQALEAGKHYLAERG